MTNVVDKFKSGIEAMSQPGAKASGFRNVMPQAINLAPIFRARGILLGAPEANGVPEMYGKEK